MDKYPNSRAFFIYTKWPEIKDNKSAVIVMLERRSRTYITGRLLKSAVHAEFKIETSDRLSAEVGPTADLLFFYRRRKSTSNFQRMPVHHHYTHEQYHHAYYNGKHAHEDAHHPHKS